MNWMDVYESKPIVTCKWAVVKPHKSYTVNRQIGVGRGFQICNCFDPPPILTGHMISQHAQSALQHLTDGRILLWRITLDHRAILPNTGFTVLFNAAKFG